MAHLLFVLKYFISITGNVAFSARNEKGDEVLIEESTEIFRDEFWCLKTLLQFQNETSFIDWAMEEILPSFKG